MSACGRVRPNRVPANYYPRTQLNDVLIASGIRLNYWIKFLGGLILLFHTNGDVRFCIEQNRTIAKFVV